MAEINLSNSAGRDAAVTSQSVRSPLKVRWVDQQGRQANSMRLLKAPIDHDMNALLAQLGDPGKVADAIINGDPELDLENIGRYLKETSRVYVNAQGQIMHSVQFWEIVKNPDGTERERRPRILADPNVSADTPLKWSGKFIKKNEASRKFVFSGKVQLFHINGLTYDFLFGMAKELEEKNCLMLLAAGPKSNQPLILRRGGTPYRGFLEGRTRGDQYALILHFSNQELKAPTEPTESAS